MEQCPNCKAHAVEVDTDCCEKVCTSCGNVLSDKDGIYTTSSGPQEYEGYTPSIDYSRKRTFPNNVEKERSDWIPEGRLIAFKHLHCVVSSFSVPKSIEKSCKDKLNRILQASPYRNMANDNKIVVATCLLYALLRQNDWPLTIRTLCDAAHIDKVSFGKIYPDVLKYFELTIATSSLEDLVPSYVKGSILKDDNAITDVAIQLLELSKSTWLSYGKRPDAVISAAIYVAWMAADVSKRSTIKYKDFCTRHSLRYIEISLMRVRELMEILTKLCLELPWNKTKKSVNKREVLFSLSKILQYQKSLLLDLKINDTVPYPFIPAKRKKLERPANDKDIVIGFVSESQELTEDDIPSSQMHEFIRSDSEVEEIKILCSRTENNAEVTV